MKERWNMSSSYRNGANHGTSLDGSQNYVGRFLRNFLSTKINDQQPKQSKTAVSPVVLYGDPLIKPDRTPYTSDNGRPLVSYERKVWEIIGTNKVRQLKPEEWPSDLKLAAAKAYAEKHPEDPIVKSRMLAYQT